MKLSDTAWLIERERLCLGICDHRLAWVTFTNENALRFSRQSDAYGLMEVLKWEPFKLFDQMQGAIVTEHSWSAAPLATTSPQECEHRLNLSSDATVRCIDCFKSWKIYSSEVAGDLRLQLRRAEQEVVALNKEIERIASGAGAAPPAASGGQPAAIPLQEPDNYYLPCIICGFSLARIEDYYECPYGHRFEQTGHREAIHGGGDD